MKYTDKQIKEILRSAIILVDTREKSHHITENFDKYDIKWKSQKLDFGDYSIMIPQNKDMNIEEDIYFNEIAIERKNSLNELGSNISTNRDRFKREFERCKDGKVILMIEDNTYSDIINNNYNNKIEPNSFLAMLHSLSVEFNVPFIFIDSKYSFVYIYKTLYYYTRNKLKQLHMENVV